LRFPERSTSRTSPATLTAVRERLLLPLLLAALSAGGCGNDAAERDAAPPERREAAPTPTTDLPADVAVTFVGRGADAAWILRPRGRPRAELPVVLFGHGWFATNPRLYRGWVTHLVRRGNVVVYPVYQTVPFLSPELALEAFTNGVRTALERTPHTTDGLVAAGHSAGGALVADYAATAADRGLPVPEAILSAYPGRKLPRFDPRIPEEDLTRIPPTTEVLALAGATDVVVGADAARSLVRQAPDAELVTIRDPGASDHRGPQRADDAARRAFWRRLDALIRRARS
jgi:acetyl esterase/lipase